MIDFSRETIRGLVASMSEYNRTLGMIMALLCKGRHLAITAMVESTPRVEVDQVTFVGWDKGGK